VGCFVFNTPGENRKPNHPRALLHITRKLLPATQRVWGCLILVWEHVLLLLLLLLLLVGSIMSAV
jgi:hypothetical protein